MESLFFSQSTTTLIESTVLLITQLDCLIDSHGSSVGWFYLRIFHRTVTKFTRLHCIYARNLLENWQVFERKSYCKKILYIKIQFTSDIIITNIVFVSCLYYILYIIL